MRAFEYASPATKEQAVGLLSDSFNNAAILAGGTDLLALMKDDIVHPRRLVNVKELKELRGITWRAHTGLHIGALATLHEISEHAEVRRQFPALAEACADAASPQIRFMATIGGNLAQRPRCWYFRNGMGLLAQDQSGKSLVPEGDNRYHAILGNQGPAYFVSPSSVAPLLIALNATVRFFGPRGARQLLLEQFFRIPKSANEREHDLRPNELITEITIPPAPNVRAAHYEVRQKEAFDWPLATASVALKMTGKTIDSARVVLGHVAPIPWLSAEAADALTRKTADEDNVNEAARVALSKARSLGDNGYKIQLARVALKRAVLKAAGAA
jgi:xanthine dehydrogenase YagS FAD-binding subunit